jgi:hypothetical protein
MAQSDFHIEVVYTGQGCLGGGASYDQSLPLSQFLRGLYQQQLKVYRLIVDEQQSSTDSVNYLNFLESRGYLPIQGVDVETGVLNLKQIRDQNIDMIRLVDLLEPGSFFLLPQAHPLSPGC